jgi:hypothetical protein
MLTVVCWKWEGWRPVYTAEHVHNLRAMLAKHLTIPHRFLCITDKPDEIPGIDTMQLWEAPHGLNGVTPGIPSCYARLRLFSHWARDAIGEHILSIDLDSIIMSNIDDLITDDSFRILSGHASPYNGSMWMVKPGIVDNLWARLNATTARRANRQRHSDGSRYYGSDQAFMSHQIPNAPTWGRDDGLYQYPHIMHGPVPENARVIFFAGPKKPWETPLNGLYLSESGQVAESVAG